MKVLRAASRWTLNVPSVSVLRFCFASARGLTIVKTAVVVVAALASLGTTLAIGAVAAGVAAGRFPTVALLVLATGWLMPIPLAVLTSPVTGRLVRAVEQHARTTIMATALAPAGVAHLEDAGFGDAMRLSEGTMWMARPAQGVYGVFAVLQTRIVAGWSVIVLGPDAE